MSPPSHQRDLALQKFFDGLSVGGPAPWHLAVLNAFEAGWDAQAARVAELGEEIEELTVRIKLHEDPVFSRRQLQAKHDALEKEGSELFRRYTELQAAFSELGSVAEANLERLKDEVNELRASRLALYCKRCVDGDQEDDERCPGCGAKSDS